MIRTSTMTSVEFARFVATHPVSGAKGDSTVQSAETSQAQFSQTLQNAFAQTFGASQGVLNLLNGKLTSMVNNPTGFTPQTMASLNTNAIQQAATDTNNAKVASQQAAAMHGGNGLPSGVAEQINAGINAAGANEESSNLNQINLANAQQQQSNYWNAVSGLSGVAQAENPNSFASNANSSSGALAGLSQANSAAQQAGAFDQFMGGLGKGLGAGLGSFATGGLSNLTNWGSGPGQK